MLFHFLLSWYHAIKLVEGSIFRIFMWSWHKRLVSTFGPHSIGLSTFTIFKAAFWGISFWDKTIWIPNFRWAAEISKCGESSALSMFWAPAAAWRATDCPPFFPANQLDIAGEFLYPWNQGTSFPCSLQWVFAVHLGLSFSRQVTEENLIWCKCNENRLSRIKKHYYTPGCEAAGRDAILWDEKYMLFF